MVRRLLLCLFAACLTSAVALNHDNSPWYCHDHDCPKFDVLKDKDDYELRRYPATSWVSTVVESYFYDVAVTVGFVRLYKYIAGANEDSVVLEMTAPVRVKVDGAAEGHFIKSNYTISFFLPFDYQDLKDAPKPTNPLVFLETTPSFDVYVKDFGGFAPAFILNRKSKLFYHKLKDDDKDVVEEYFYFAGYDSPFHWVKRHNEVWILRNHTAAADDEVFLL